MSDNVPPPPPPRVTLSARDRLDSWKEIAAYLKRDVRTVQRWEKEHGLPVRRHVNAKQGSVFAYREELDEWWNVRRGELEVQAGTVQLLPNRSGTSRLRALTLVGVSVVVLGVGLAMTARKTPAPLRSLSLSVVLGRNVFLDTTPGGSMLALSPDGSQLAFVGRSSDRVRLYVRRLDRFETTVLARTDDAISPFFSPDGKWVGYETAGGIRRVSVEGGAPQLVCATPEPEGGAAWLADDTIVFSGGNHVGLMRVEARGGTARPITRLNMSRGELRHTQPTMLPGGRALLYSAVIPDGRPRIDAVSLDTGEQRDIIDDAVLLGYVNGVGIVFRRRGHAVVAPFDPDRLVVTGEPVALPDDVDTDDMAITSDGMVAYVPFDDIKAERTLVWVNPDGSEEPIPAPPRPYRSPKLSPDGRTLAIEVFEADRPHVWLYDLVRSALTPLSTTVSRSPFWTPDSKRVIVTAPQNGIFMLFSYPSDRSGPGEVLTSECMGDGAFSHDGKRLFCTHTFPRSPTAGDLWTLDMTRGQGKLLVVAPSIQTAPKPSPDGKWLAYMSDESGRWEVYMTTLPDARGKWQISVDGGNQPVWAPDGRTLYFRGSGKMMTVTIERSRFSSELVPHAPVPLFEDNYFEGHPAISNFDVSPDGSRLLMVKGDRIDRMSEIRVIQGWRVPGDDGARRPVR